MGEAERGALAQSQPGPAQLSPTSPTSSIPRLRTARALVTSPNSERTPVALSADELRQCQWEASVSRVPCPPSLLPLRRRGEWSGGVCILSLGGCRRLLVLTTYPPLQPPCPSPPFHSSISLPLFLLLLPLSQSPPSVVRSPLSRSAHSPLSTVLPRPARRSSAQHRRRRCSCATVTSALAIPILLPLSARDRPRPSTHHPPSPLCHSTHILHCPTHTHPAVRHNIALPLNLTTLNTAPHPHHLSATHHCDLLPLNAFDGCAVCVSRDDCVSAGRAVELELQRRAMPCSAQPVVFSTPEQLLGHCLHFWVTAQAPPQQPQQRPTPAGGAMSLLVVAELSWCEAMMSSLSSLHSAFAVDLNVGPEPPPRHRFTFPNPHLHRSIGTLRYHHPHGRQQRWCRCPSR